MRKTKPPRWIVCALSASDMRNEAKLGRARVRARPPVIFRRTREGKEVVHRMTRRNEDRLGRMIETLESRRLLAATTGLPPASGLGGAGLDGAFTTATDSSGNSVVAGVFSGTADFQPGNGVTTLKSVGQSD